MAMPELVTGPERSHLLSDPALRNALLRFVRSRVPASEAEDIVQSVLTDALSAARAPEEPEELRRWVHGIARNKIADYHRRAGRELPREPGTEDAVADSAPISARELLHWAEQELPEGSEAHSTLEWMLREGDGEKLEHIAGEANLPAPRVRQRVSRLRRHFRERWAQVVAAAVAIGVLLFAAYKLMVPQPEIAQEQTPPVTPRDRAEELRREGLDLCGAEDWRRCLELLDRAKGLDPQGDTDVRVERARAAAAKALAPKPAPAPELPEPESPENVAPSPKKETPKPPRPITTEAPPPPISPKSQAPPRPSPKSQKSDIFPDSEGK